ncbi:MAG TPA: SAM-dependent methyltransferase [Sphingobacteriaceae bacterium]|nr:SAM-dependent methyltransferase [Sphingobacteriaceae bacterium]
MENFDRKNHWENIYQTKNLEDVSWYQSIPTTSLEFLEQSGLPKTAEIIDIGGGDSLLVDHLLDLGYQKITVLDISETSIKRAKERLGIRSQEVSWIVSDITLFNPSKKYDFWHDRAAFHFLTIKQDIDKYLVTVQQGIKPGGTMVIGTFSEEGPKKCSGIEIKQYSETAMINIFKDLFKEIRCVTINHSTPVGTIQNFTFCSFNRTG